MSNKVTSGEIRALELYTQAAGAVRELMQIAAKAGAQQKQAVTSLVDMGCSLSGYIEWLHKGPLLPAEASPGAIRAATRSRKAALTDAAARSIYPVLMHNDGTGNVLPTWAKDVNLFPEPLRNGQHPTASRQQLRELMRAFAFEFESPIDIFTASEEGDLSAHTVLRDARLKGTKAYRSAFAREFKRWMKNNFTTIVEDPLTPLGGVCAARKGGRKDAWAVLYDLALSEARHLNPVAIAHKKPR